MNKLVQVIIGIIALIIQVIMLNEAYIFIDLGVANNILSLLFTLGGISVLIIIYSILMIKNNKQAIYNLLIAQSIIIIVEMLNYYNFLTLIDDISYIKPHMSYSFIVVLLAILYNKLPKQMKPK